MPKAAKRTRDLERSRKEILDAAFLLIYARGFQGVSVDDIVKKTKLTKGAFYHQFPTKLDLGYALVDEVIKPMVLKRWVEPLEKFEYPLDGILSQMEELIGRSDLKYGCPLNNLVQEMSPIDRGFHRRLQSALQYWIDGIETHLQRAKKIGLLKRDVNTTQVAQFIVMAHEGFYGLLKGIPDPKLFQALLTSLKAYFRTLEA
jgi:AcrR family transcriptional regulator